MPAAGDPEVLRAALPALAELLSPVGTWREIVIERVDRDPVATSSLAEPLRELGFRQAYRGWVLERA